MVWIRGRCVEFAPPPPLPPIITGPTVQSGIRTTATVNSIHVRKSCETNLFLKTRSPHSLKSPRRRFEPPICRHIMKHTWSIKQSCTGGHGHPSKQWPHPAMLNFAHPQRCCAFCPPSRLVHLKVCIIRYV